MTNNRSQAFLNRRARPISTEESTRILRLRTAPENGTHFWRTLGPRNIAGRSTCVAIDPRRPSDVYLGTASGGLWFSADQGENWEPKTDDLDTLNIGSLAFDPANPDCLYIGTGEANLMPNSLPGLGIYRYGVDPKWIGLSETDELPRRIGCIAADPSRQGHLLVGSATIVQGDRSGMFRGTPEGETYQWKLISGFTFGVDENKHVKGPRIDSVPYRCHAILFHPAKPGLVFAALDMRGWRSGIWRSIDSGETWEQLQGGLPAAESFGRISLALSPAEPNAIWAYAGTQSGGMHGVFYSSDLGNSWQLLGRAHFAREAFSSYSNCIAVHPENADWVICGGKHLHRTLDRGQTWQQVTESDSGPGDPNYAHAHHHALVVLPSGFIYDANDGGMSIGTRIGNQFAESWLEASFGIVSATVNSLDVSAGGIACTSQGIGTLLLRDGEDSRKYRLEMPGFDGAVVFDPDDPDHTICTGPASWVAVHKSGWTITTPQGLLAAEKEATMRPCLAIDRSMPKRTLTRTILMGTTRVWRSRDGGFTWTPMTPELDGSPITALEISPTNPRRMAAGTHDGGVYRSTDGGNNWSENLAGIDMAASSITSLLLPSTGEEFLCLTLGADPGFVAGSVGGRILLSEDGGETWGSIDPNRTLPDVSHNAMAFSAARQEMYIGTDFGVYRGVAIDSSTMSWTDISGNLPKTFVTALVMHEPSHSLIAATHGRGLFVYDLEAGDLPPLQEVVEAQRKAEAAARGKRKAVR